MSAQHATSESENHRGVASSARSASAARHRHRDSIPSFFVLIVLAALSLLYNFSSVENKFGRVEENCETEPLQEVVSYRRREPVVYSNTTTIARQVDFLTPGNFLGEGEMYSGAWWQNREAFLKIPYGNMYFLEQATFSAFRWHRMNKRSHNSGIRLTRDWLDFSVEHLSKYVKHISWLSQQNNETFHEKQLFTILSNYLENAVMFPRAAAENKTGSALAPQSTIAILPVKSSNKDATNKLLIIQMAATLASLWKVGVGRAVVVGVSEAEHKLANAAFELLAPKVTIRAMELGYVQHNNATSEEEKLVPKVALIGLQKAMRGENSNMAAADVEQWLGTEPSRWNYVYFSEPDLLLQTRPSALPDISQALSDGLLMAAHRLEPLAHEHDFPTGTAKKRNDQSFLLPDYGPFSAVFPLGDSDVCCDQGKYYLANKKTPAQQEKVVQESGCRSIWSQCGFAQKGKDYRDRAVVLEMHYRLLGYPFFTLQGGTGLPLVGASQRVCVPRFGPDNCAAG